MNWLELGASLRDNDPQGVHALCETVARLASRAAVSLWSIGSGGSQATCVAAVGGPTIPDVLIPAGAWSGLILPRHSRDAPWPEATDSAVLRKVGIETPQDWGPVDGADGPTAATVRLYEDNARAWYLVALCETEAEAAGTAPLLELVASSVAAACRQHDDLDFREIVDSSPGITLVLRDGRIVYANPATLQALGYTRTELCDAAFDPLTVVHPRDRRRLRGLTAGKIEEDPADAPFEATLLARDGRAVDVVMSVTARRTPTGRLVHVRAIDISERVRLETELFAYTGQVGALQELLKDILELDLTRSEILERICKSVCAITGADIVCAFLFKPDRSALALEAYHGPQADNSTWFADMQEMLGEPMCLPEMVWTGTGALARSLDSKEPVVVEHAMEPQGRTYPGLVEQTGMEAYLWVPMLPGPEPLGVLYIGYQAATIDMNDSQVQALSLFAAQAALSLQKTALVEEERQRQDESSQLLTATAALREDLALPALYERIAVGARRVVPAQFASVVLPADEESLVVVHVDGDAPADVTAHRFPIASTLGGRVFRAGTPVRWDESSTEDLGDSAHVLAVPVHQTLLVPLMSQGQTIGVLALVNKPGNSPFTDRDQQLLETYAQQAAGRLDNATLLAQVTETKEYLEYLMDSARDIIYAHDLDGAFTMVNAVGRRFLVGDAPGPLPNVMDVIHPEDRPAAQREMEHLRQGNSQRVPIGLRLRNAEGKYRLLEIAARSIEHDGEPVGLLGVGRDVTERRQLEDQVLRVERLTALGGLLSGVAHELNNPLTGVLGYAELLAASRDPTVSEQAGRIYAEAQRCRTIVDSLLALHPDSEREADTVACGPLVEQAVALVRYRYELDNVHVVVTRDDDLPAVRAPADQLQRALLHVLENAREAIVSTGETGRITVTTTADPEHVRIVVEDTGVGLAADAGDRIFDPFYTTKSGPGRGLGLSMVYNVMAAAGGTVSVEAKAPTGTRATLAFPALAEVPVDPPTPAGAAVVPARAARVLVVDDEEVIRELLSDLLGMMEYTVDVVQDGAAALAKLSQHAYAGIVSDIKMPGMNGMELFREIRAQYPRMVDRIVFSSGDTMTPETRAFLEEAGRPYICKPFNLSDLRAVVSQVVDGPHANV